MRRLPHALFAILVLAAAPPVVADGMNVWRTPEGDLHIGVRPPEGSTLIERREFEERESDEEENAQVRTRDEALAEAAEDGREIIRRRAAEREAEKARRAAAQVPVLAEREPASSTVIVVDDGFRGGFGGGFRGNVPTVSPKPPFRPLPAQSNLPRIAPSPFSGARTIAPRPEAPVVGGRSSFGR